MRFLEDGADIPEELIHAVTDGNAVFLCGAGVSRRVGLPSFEELTEQVYRELGETRDNEPAERIAFERWEYDRVLRSLEKRTHRPGTPSRVRVAVANLLAAEDGLDHTDHGSFPLPLNKPAPGVYEHPSHYLLWSALRANFPEFIASLREPALPRFLTPWT